MSISRIENEPQTVEYQITSTYDFAEAERRLRQAPLKDRAIPGFCPYRRSKISLVEMSFDELSPCALYVLSANLERTERTREILLQQGIDIFDLNPDQTVVEYTCPDGTFSLSPPLVEVSEDDNRARLIVDGLHRVEKAKEKRFNSMPVFRIENAAVPVVSLPVQWSAVRVYDEVPPSEQKRMYRFETMGEIRRWVAHNYSRFMQGFDFSELDWGNCATNNRDLAHDPEIEKLCKETSASAVISTEDNRVLLVKRRGEGEDLWALPAGYQEISDFGHPFSMIMRRESDEETGLIPLHWRALETIMTPDYHFGHVFEAVVTDGVHVDMDLADYVDCFNQRSGNPEVKSLGLFTLSQIRSMADQNQLFRPEYNLRAVETYFERKANPPKIPTCFAAWDIPSGIFWESQPGIELVETGISERFFDRNLSELSFRKS